MHLDKIKSIPASPKIGVSEFFGIPLFAFGTYLFSTFDAEEDIYVGLRKFWGGAAAYTLSAITFVDGNNAESKIYYFMKR